MIFHRWIKHLWRTPGPTLVFAALLLAACQPRPASTATLPPPTPTVFGPGLGYAITTVPVAPPLPTATPPTGQNGLIQYQNPALGLQLEYPGSYQAPENAGCELQARIDENGGGLVQVGRRTSITVRPVEQELTLANAAAQLRQELELRAFEITAETGVQVAGVDAIQFDYRFGGTNRFGRATLLLANQRQYSLTLVAGDFCPAEGSILNTFTLLSPAK